MRLTERTYWERRWRARAALPRSGVVHPRCVPFHPLFAKLLPRDLSYVEVGCAPGRTMAYFHRHFGYRVAGIDYAAEDVCRRTLAENGVETYRLYAMDFLDELPAERFDVVASFGFVEHFTDLETVLARHVALLNPGGYVVVGVPNYRGLQRLLRRLLDPAALARHNLAAMEPATLRRILAGLGAREFPYCGPYRTFGIWLDREDAPRWACRAVGLCDAAFQRLARPLRLDDLPSRWLSPYVLVIARF